MRKNRELRDQQLAEAERLAQIEKRERDREAPGAHTHSAHLTLSTQCH